jgi:hypothetical protein
MTTSATPPAEETLRGAGYEKLVERLSRQSVAKHFDAYTDVPWDDPAYRIDPDDPRFELGAEHPLGGTAWYRAQPAGVRSRIGLHNFASLMKSGAQFENVLQRGLLEFALRLPNGSPEFRYVYHEVIEEGHHSLMFQEFVNRTGFDVPGLPWWAALASRRVVTHARRFPALFFVFVLGGEDPIDHVQRTALSGSAELHPLVKRIMQIHVTEEARHICFARHYLRKQVPKLGPLARTALAIGAPIVLGQMARLMLEISPDIARTYRIPRAVLRKAYGSPAHRRATLASLDKVRALLVELGLVHRWSHPVWSAAGLAA